MTGEKLETETVRTPGPARRAEDAALLCLGNEAITVELLPDVGGRIHRLIAFGVDLLRVPKRLSEHRRRPLYWGCYPLIPWSNRVPDGRLVFGGREYPVPCNFGSHAIHGLLFQRRWDVIAFDNNGAHLRTEWRGDEYPWPFVVDETLEVDGATLKLRLEVTNLGDGPMPAGIGIHPWFKAYNGVRLAMPAEQFYWLEDCIPVSDPVPVAGGFDFRRERTIPFGLDHLWTGLTGREVRMTWPSKGLRLRMSFSESASHVVVASFRNYDCVLVEPVTHATDGHRRLHAGLPGGIDVLEPGQSLAVDYVFQFERRDVNA